MLDAVHTGWGLCFIIPDWPPDFIGPSPGANPSCSVLHTDPCCSFNTNSSLFHARCKWDSKLLLDDDKSICCRRYTRWSERSWRCRMMSPRPRNALTRYSVRWTRILTGGCRWRSSLKVQRVTRRLFGYCNVSPAHSLEWSCDSAAPDTPSPPVCVSVWPAFCHSHLVSSMMQQSFQLQVTISAIQSILEFMKLNDKSWNYTCSRQFVSIHTFQKVASALCRYCNVCWLHLSVSHSGPLLVVLSGKHLVTLSPNLVFTRAVKVNLLYRM